MSKLKAKSLTVGKLRELIADLPAETQIYPDWQPGYLPGEYEPGVEITGITLAGDKRGKYLSIEVKLFQLEE